MLAELVGVASQARRCRLTRGAGGRDVVRLHPSDATSMLGEQKIYGSCKAVVKLTGGSD